MMRNFLVKYRDDIIKGDYGRLQKDCKTANYELNFENLGDCIFWADEVNPKSVPNVAIAVVAGYLDRVPDRMKVLDEEVRPALRRLREDEKNSRFYFTLALLGD